MAQGYLQHFAGDRAEVFSAGVETHGVNPEAIECMKEDGIDISHHTSNHIDEYKNTRFDFVITVCDHAREVCPYFPTEAKQIHYNFKDPSKIVNESERRQVFTEVRNQIKEFCRKFILDNIGT
jgi:arsenate reductase